MAMKGNQREWYQREDVRPENNRLADRVARSVPVGVHPKGWEWAVRYLQEFANLEGMLLRPATLEQWAELLAGYERARGGVGPVEPEEAPPRTERPAQLKAVFESLSQPGDSLVRAAANNCHWYGSKTDFATDLVSEINRLHVEGMPCTCAKEGVNRCPAHA